MVWGLCRSFDRRSELLVAAYNVCNKNPLGSAAGYGSSFPIDREFTTEKLDSETLNYNVVYAQMTRGKTEKIRQWQWLILQVRLVSSLMMYACI